MSLFSSHNINIESLFQGFLEIPNYQREYVWTERLVEELLSDLYSAFSEGNGTTSQYFLGTIVVADISAKQTQEVIDGQQRITTLFILLVALRDYWKEQGEDTEVIQQQLYGANVDPLGNTRRLHRVVLQYADSQDVLECLVDEPSALRTRNISTSTRSAKNLVEAYKAIDSFIRETLGDIGQAKRFYAYLIKSVYFVRIQTDSVERALRIFETINSRGQSLDAADLLKNLLFRNAPPDEYERLKERWKLLSDTLFSAGERTLAFIRYHLLARYALGKLKSDSVYKWMTDEDNPNRPPYETAPLQFATELVTSVRYYTHYISGKDRDGNESAPLKNILLFNRSARQHVIPLLASSHLATEAQNRLATALERLTFVSLVSRQQANVYEQLYVDWAIELRQISSADDLDSFIQDKVEARIDSLRSDFVSAFTNLRFDSMPRYRVKYILARLSQYVDELAYGERPLSDYLGRAIDIDHIMPQSPDTQTAMDFGGLEPAQDYVGRLANLTLLERPLNASASNKPYAEKRAIYGKSRFLLTQVLSGSAQVGKNTSINRAIAELSDFDKWSPSSFSSRQNDLVKLAMRIWYA